MPNHLAQEKSPYLLQHANNPVDWHPWGPAAFELARSQNRLIFLSIGYATCHWCHVMERESFEDAATAELLNANFVAIKVDREERPDVDQIYMRALQAVGQQGGWPLNMFLTPALQPITGGTYFPPAPAYGRPSFGQILESVASTWQKEPQRLLEAATALTGFLEPGKRSATTLPTARALENAAAEFEKKFDPYRGGFLNNGNNKFPPSMGLLFLMGRFRATKDRKYLDITETTLDAMLRGGIYDQVGGGLARYSTDHDWLVPHFEKMLYDNALLAEALTECYRITKNERYKRWALDIFEYIQRDMTSSEGAFFSAEDADSEGVEGKFYVWKENEIKQVLKEAGLTTQEIGTCIKLWGVSARGNFEGECILNEPLPRDEFCRAVSMTPEAVEALRTKARAALLRKRSVRIRPLLDDKVLTGWNALMISALSQAARVFAMPDLAARASSAATFIWQNLRNEKGGLLRRYRDGEARHLATLSDYALLGCAFVDLYRATFDSSLLEKATLLAANIVERFDTTEGGYYDADAAAEELIVRSIDSYDGVEPSGNSAAARLFLSLSSYGIEHAHNRSRCERILSYFGTALSEYGTAHPAMLRTLEAVLTPAPEVAIVGSGASTQAGVDRLALSVGPDAAVACWDGNSTAPAASVPLLAERVAKFPYTTFYVCRDLACQQPVGTVEEALELIE